MLVVLVSQTIDIVLFVMQNHGLGSFILSCSIDVNRLIVCWGLHITEVIVFPRQNRGSLYASTPDVYSSCVLICPFGVPTPPVFSYCSGFFFNGTEEQKRVIGYTAEVKMSVLSLMPFFELFASIL